MRLIWASLCLIGFAGAAATASAATAMATLRAIPPEQARMVAMVTSRESNVDPSRWHIILHDPQAENGLREIVIDKGKRTANRTISQFAEKLTMADVFSPDAVRVDSDKAIKIVQDYATANSALIATMNLELWRGGSDQSPLWTITCTDIAGIELGKLVISATRGTVILHSGFPIEPSRLERVAEGSSAGTATAGATNPDGSPITPAATPRPAPPKKKATPTPTPTPGSPKPNLLKRLFGGRDNRNP